MSQNNKHKERQEKKKSKLLPILGVLLFIMAIIQIAILFISITAKPSHNAIVVNGDTKTSEICEDWYRLPEAERDLMASYTYEFYTGDMQLNKRTAIIPIDMINEVCPKWLKVKEEIDNEKR